MTPTPRAMLLTRLAAILLIGLGLGSTAIVVAYLGFDPGMWSDIWERRAGGPIAIVTNLLATWFQTLTSLHFWTTYGPSLFATSGGAVLLLRTRTCVSRCSAWVLR